MIAAGLRRHLVTLSAQSVQAPASPDETDGGYETDPTPLSPASVFAEIKPATARDLERLAAGTSIATATHILTMPFHPGVNTKTVIAYRGRTFRVTGVVNVDEQDRETVVAASEVMP